jgi:hypothetical protein
MSEKEILLAEKSKASSIIINYEYIDFKDLEKRVSLQTITQQQSAYLKD